MADIPENIDLRFLAEQQARILQELLDLRKEQHEMRVELAQVHAGQNEIAGEVAALGVNMRELKETLAIVEHDISGIKLRIERLERHAGLVRT